MLWKLRGKKWSSTNAWQCSACRKIMRTPLRVDHEIYRVCKCRIKFTFGPKTGDGEYLSRIEIRSEKPMQ